MLDSCSKCGSLMDVDGYNPEIHGPNILCGVDHCKKDKEEMAEQDKLFMTPGQAKRFLKKQIPFWKRRGWIWCVWLFPDTRFYCPPKAHAIEQGEKIMEELRAIGFQWTEESSDCDDFACIGSGVFKKTNFKDAIRRAGWCGGEIWGKLVMDPNKPPVYHAMLWVIVQNGKGDPELIIMEPQNGSWRSLHKNDKSFRMVKA